MTTTKRLDIRDLPRDPQHFQGPLRIQLVKMANYVRKYPAKADDLVKTIEAVLTHVKSNIEGVVVEEKELTVVEQLQALQVGVAKLTNKGEVIAQAAKVGLELSEEASRSELNEALTTKYAELIELQETK